MKKIMFVFLALMLCACSNNDVKESEGAYTNAKQEKTTAKVKWNGDEIKEVELDETTGDTTKKTLGADYHMKDASTIGKEWNEQVQFLEKYIEKNGITGIKFNDEGKAENEDIITGCTISIENFIKAIEDAQTKAK